MVARDLSTGRVTKPVRGDEPHIGATVNTDPKPATKQTGYSKGGTTNPPIGESGEVEIVEFDEADES